MGSGTSVNAADAAIAEAEAMANMTVSGLFGSAEDARGEVYTCCLVHGNKYRRTPAHADLNAEAGLLRFGESVCPVLRHGHWLKIDEGKWLPMVFFWGPEYDGQWLQLMREVETVSDDEADDEEDSEAATAVREAQRKAKIASYRKSKTSSSSSFSAAAVATTTFSSSSSWSSGAARVVDRTLHGKGGYSRAWDFLDATVRQVGINDVVDAVAQHCDRLLAKIRKRHLEQDQREREYRKARRKAKREAARKKDSEMQQLKAMLEAIDAKCTTSDGDSIATTPASSSGSSSSSSSSSNNNNNNNQSDNMGSHHQKAVECGEEAKGQVAAESKLDKNDEPNNARVEETSGSNKEKKSKKHKKKSSRSGKSKGHKSDRHHHNNTTELDMMPHDAAL
jgi:hypothetical protein